MGLLRHYKVRSKEDLVAVCSRQVGKVLVASIERLEPGNKVMQPAFTAGRKRARHVPLLARHLLRRERWDAHPGVLYGGRKKPDNMIRLDCHHSSFAPGAFDVEVLSFTQALQARFGV